MKTPDPPPPPRRYTSPTGRIVIPALLVVLLIVVLGRPILVSGLNLDETEPDPIPTEDGNGRNGNDRGPNRLASQYPKACLSDDSQRGLGLIAAAAGGSVSVRSPTGSQAFALRAEPPIGWSASGKFLATAGADLWTDRGNRIGIAFSRPVEKWAWSPTADCIVAIEGNRLVVVQPHQRAEFLVRGMKITSFTFSPDGTHLVWAVQGRGAGLWVADLRSGGVERLQSSTGWLVLGWFRPDRPILSRIETAVQGKGIPPLAYVPSDRTSRCGEDVLTITNRTIDVLVEGGTPDPIPADSRFDYTSVACSPDGDLLVAVRAPRRAATSMVVLRRNGAVVEEIAQQSQNEDHPMWGPRGTGVVFAATAGGEGSPGPLVWFIPEGGTARTTGLRVGRLGDDLDARLDWSATPPLGYPTN